MIGIQRKEVERICHTLDREEAVQFGSPALIKPDEYPPEDLLRAQLQKALHCIHKAKKDIFTPKKRKWALHRKTVSLQYRLGKKFGGEDRLEKTDDTLFARLQAEAAHWKSKQISCAGEPLNDFEKNQLRKLTTYPKLTELLLQNRKHTSHFFKWALINKLSVEVFAEFPAVTKNIDASLLKPRIGAFGGEGLKFVDAAGVKDVTLEIEGKPVSIIDPARKITLSHKLNTTVGEIFKTFGKKNLDEGHLTYFKDGVFNWDPHQFGPKDGVTGNVNAIDLEQADWYKQLPMLAHLTTDEATQKFGVPCDGKNWVMTVVATCQTKRMTTFGAHSFFRLAIPRGDGTYDYTYGWGKFAKRYPQNALETVSMLFGPVQATLEYPDNNEVYTSRKKVEMHFSIPHEKGAACLESLRNDLRNVRLNNFAFQILTTNCTDWVIQKVHDFVGDKESRMFDINFMQLEPEGLLGTMIKILRKFPEWFQRIFLTILGFILGGCRKLKLTLENGQKRVICILKDPPWQKGRVFRHPGVIFRRPLQIHS